MGAKTIWLSVQAAITELRAIEDLLDERMEKENGAAAPLLNDPPSPRSAAASTRCPTQQDVPCGMDILREACRKRNQAWSLSVDALLNTMERSQ